MDGLFKNCSSLTDINIPSNLWFISSEMFMNTNVDESTIFIGNNIYGIENYGLSGTEIEHFVVPDPTEDGHTIEYIGDYAFKDCKSLKTADLTHLAETLNGYYKSSGTITAYNNTKGMFSGCKLLETVQMPTSVNWNKNDKGTIGVEMFDGCGSLTSVNLVCEETTVNSCAFRNCSLLATLTDENHYVVPNTSSFEGCMRLENIRAYALSKKVPPTCFKEARGLKNVEILYNGSGVITINSGCFTNCKALETITFPAGMTSLDIGSSAFSGCSKLKGNVFKDITISGISSESFKDCSELDYIDVSALSLTQSLFEGCEKLHGDTAESNVLTIKKTSTLPSKTFMGCSSLTELAFTGTTNITTIGSSCFEGCTSLLSLPAEITSTITGINSRGFASCEAMENYTCSNIINKINSEAFYNCRSLKRFSVPSTATDITSVNENCFYNCFALEEISFPKATTVYNKAFYGCSSLTTVDLPAVQYIQPEAFSGCSSLTTFPNLPKIKQINA